MQKKRDLPQDGMESVTLAPTSSHTNELLVTNKIKFNVCLPISK